LDAATLRHEVAAHNLAHINVPGFRRGVVINETFGTQFDQELSGGGSLGTHVEGVETDFSAGGLQQTGRPLDLALSGDGFFVLDGPNGPLYTRNGVFHIDAENRLVTATGLAVLGEGGPIKLDGLASPSQLDVNRDGALTIKDGLGNPPIDTLRIVRFADNHVLVPVGTTAFAAPAGTPTQDSDAVVAQGMRESSNVSVVSELVQLIAISRYFDVSQRAMRALDDAVQNNTDPNTG
jgi:flagellar basal body rod protein FlgG